ncbi:MAG: glycogen debranching protein [Sphingobacteriales bacterium]|nr:glycogen debranching protein [Sphingobacteriales bacterium]
MKIRLNREELLDLQISLKKEYLLTNGKGGYCSSTILDCHSRKYHGLLVLPISGTGKLFNLLSKIEVNVVLEGKDFHLSTNKFPGIYHPTGHKYIEYFELENYPVTNYRIGDTFISKSIVMPYLSDTVLVKYEVKKSEKPILLKATPMLAYREIHMLSKENLNIAPRTYFEKNGFKIDPYPGLPPVFIQTNVKSEFFPSPQWWKNFEYLKERNRGYDYQEDLFIPGVFEITLKEGDAVIFRASLDVATENIDNEWNDTVKYYQKTASMFKDEAEPLKSLKIAAGSFLIKNTSGQDGIVAGYHWFGEWGRDTLISLPGLTLCRGDFSTARNILKKFCGLERNGALPNIIDEKGGHAYNCVDTPFLMFWACQHYLNFTNDSAFIENEMLPMLQNIASAVIDQKMPNVWHGEDGLIYAGNESTNLTWMDAMVDGRPVTPRHGAAVEINALWYNAIQFLLKDFGEKIDPALKSRLIEAAEKFEYNFEEAFWNEPDQCLYDYYRGHHDRSWFIRPNQLFAIGLPYTCISKERAILMIETIDKHLVTHYGLRTLSPRNPNYKGEYRGEQRLRDLAYHNGMVWPWLIGIYTDALFKVYGDKDMVREKVKSQFEELWTLHREQYGLFHISELFRPDPPQVAKGCMAQAWSEAEVIRVLEFLKPL